MHIPADVAVPLTATHYLRQEISGVITQTLTRSYTTFTTHVTLGPGPTLSSTTSSSTAQSTPTDVAAHHHHHRHALTAAELGGILGSVAALVIILIAVGICLTSTSDPEEENDYSSYTTTSTEEYYRPRSKKGPRKPPRVAERIPGGPKFPTYRAVPISNSGIPPVRHTR